MSATMSRKDFQFIADVIASLPKTPHDKMGLPGGWLDHYRATVANAFADALATTNARFDRARFLAACESGPNWPYVKNPPLPAWDEGPEFSKPDIYGFGENQ